MERTVRVWVGNDYVDYTLDDIPEDWSEDAIFEEAVAEVYDILTIEVLQENYGKLQRCVYPLYNKLQN